MNWIPIEDRMPMAQQLVLIAYTKDGSRRAVTMGWYAPAKTVESGYFENEVDDEYNEATDTYYLKEQWVDESRESEYHYSIGGVTHWMPLPELPEEV